MTRVDFYVLPENSRQERFACMMTHKVWSKGKPLFINTATQEMAEAFDNLLWTYHDISFIPHELINTNEKTESPVTIGWQGVLPKQTEVILNLAPEIPTNADRFARIIEIVTGDGSLRQQARNRYREYKERGYELHNHSIESDYEST
jgi:DNA polymerase-3 subunit chi